MKQTKKGLLVERVVHDVRKSALGPWVEYHSNAAWVLLIILSSVGISKVILTWAI